MCRFAAYAGPPIPMENIVTAPQNSLLAQSLNAIESKTVVNGDGFGIAWYSDGEGPGLYRDCYPAWSDANLLSLCKMVKAPIFIAHVRASTVGESARSNCHPFAQDGWAFAHNGQIGEFRKMQRHLEAQLDDRLYLARRGSTDSEVLFLLLLSHGLSDMTTAASNVIALLEKERHRQKIEAPLRLTFTLTDGHRIFAVRYASDGRAPSLYWSSQLDNGGICIASEPLDGQAQHWQEVPDGSCATLYRGQVEVEPLRWPRAA